MKDGKLRIRKTLTLSKVLGIAFLLSSVITYAYARSITSVYIALSLIIIIFAYFNYIKNYYKIDERCRLLVLLLLFVSLVNGLINSNIKSSIMLNASLLLPFAISTLSIQYKRIKNGFVVTCVLVLLFVVLQVNTNMFGEINSNTFSFLAYMGISIAFIWFKLAKSKIYPIVYLLVSYLFILQTGSRNIAIVILLCFLLLIVPENMFRNKLFYRTIYITAILYTVFAVHIMQAGFSIDTISNFLNEYTANFSEKVWTMESRVDFLLSIQEKLGNMSFIKKIIGEGICDHHGHNLFYQSVFVYGYLGTIIIYYVYFLIFEMAYKLIKAENNGVVLGCVIIMIGHFFIQGADVYMIGMESCIVMPAVIMGIIMQQYRVRQAVF